MAFANSVILYNCRLNHNGLFTCDFGGSGATRDSVMGGTNSLATYKFSYSNCTYMRKDKVIIVDENADVLEAAGVNYCRYINGDFNKSMYFYAFVESIEYVAPKTSRLHIRTDCFTTYFDRIDRARSQCFVEREHVYDDVPGYHTLPEPTPHFEQVAINRWEKIWNSATPGWFMNYFYVGAYATHASGSDPIAPSVPVDYVGNVPSPGHLYIAQVDEGAAMFEELVNQQYEISYTVIVPKSAVNTISTNVSGIYVAQDKTESDGWAGDEEIDIGGPHFTDISYGGVIHSIKNKKLCTYPYQSIEMTDLWDQSVTLKPELVCEPTVKFYLHPESGAIPSFTLYCKSYQQEDAFRNAISINGFPAVPYATSYYDQYMAIHKNQVEVEKLKMDRELTKGYIGAGVDAASGIAQLGIGSPTGTNTLGKGISGFMDTEIARRDYNAKYADLKQRPPLVRNAPDGSTKLGVDGIGFHINQWVPTKEYIDQLDSFFDRYGYNVSECKIPQWNTRPKFNYIKTAGANVSGQIPESDKEVINQLLDAGLTVWHSVEEYGIYDGAHNLAPIR